MPVLAGLTGEVLLQPLLLGLLAADEWGVDGGHGFRGDLTT